MLVLQEPLVVVLMGASGFGIGRRRLTKWLRDKMAMTNNTQQSTSRAGWEEDRVRIQAMIAERAEGGSHDPRSEALSICRRWGKPTDWVEEGCDRAEEEWTKREIEEARKGAKKVL